MAGNIADNLINALVDDMVNLTDFSDYADQIPDDITAAYDIQDQVSAALLAGGHRTALCGYKLAMNSAALMQHFGTSEPGSARMFANQMHPSGAKLSGQAYHSMLIEPEIMAEIGRDMNPREGGHDRNSAMDAIEKFVPAIELIDCRGLHLPSSRLTSVIAQNITTAGLVHGGPGMTPQLLNVETLAVLVSIDGEIVANTVGTAPQHPLDAVAWLANHLISRGLTLKAGMIVMCGTHVPPIPLDDAGDISVDMDVLGKVAFSIG